MGQVPSATVATTAHMVTLAGHSLLSCFRPAKLNNRPKLGQFIELAESPNVRLLPGTWPRDEAYWDRSLDIAAHDGLALLWNGNQQDLGFLHRHEPDIDFYWPRLDISAAMPGTKMLPQLAIRDHLSPSLDGLRVLLGRVNAAQAEDRVFVLGTPPPIGAPEAVMERVKSHRLFKEVYGRRTEKPRLSPPSLRLKVWDLLQSMMQEIAESHACRFIPSPAEASDDNGFLAEAFWGRTLTHPNHSYGAAVIRRLESLTGMR